jgi:hypothetical protein
MKSNTLAGFSKSFFALVAAGMMVFGMGGCAVVGPLLTCGGAIFTPLQYASTAYTIGEFSYEYAANDRTPDEVIQNKVDTIVAVFDDDDAELAPAVQDGPKPVMVADAEGERMDSFLYSSGSYKTQRRIEMRKLQMERLETRKMAFLEARESDLSLRQGHVRAIDLGHGADGDVTLVN